VVIIIITITIIIIITITFLFHSSLASSQKSRFSLTKHLFYTLLPNLTIRHVLLLLS
jgi:hypothetical protein